MALNPPTFAEQVVGALPRYRLTTYPLAGADLQPQLRPLVGERVESLPLAERHAFRGAHGGEAAPLVSRLRSFSGESSSEVTRVVASATMAAPERGPQAAHAAERERHARPAFGEEKYPRRCGPPSPRGRRAGTATTTAGTPAGDARRSLDRQEPLFE